MLQDKVKFMLEETIYFETAINGFYGYNHR